MNDQGKIEKIVSEIIRLEKDARLTGLRAKWEIGRAVCQAAEKFERGVLNELAEKTGILRQTLQRSREFFEAFDEDSLDELLADGFSVTPCFTYIRGNLTLGSRQIIEILRKSENKKDFITRCQAAKVVTQVTSFESKSEASEPADLDSKGGGDDPQQEDEICVETAEDSTAEALVPDVYEEIEELEDQDEQDERNDETAEGPTGKELVPDVDDQQDEVEDQDDPDDRDDQGEEDNQGEEEEPEELEEQALDIKIQSDDAKLESQLAELKRKYQALAEEKEALEFQLFHSVRERDYYREKYERLQEEFQNAMVEA